MSHEALLLAAADWTEAVTVSLPWCGAGLKQRESRAFELSDSEESDTQEPRGEQTELQAREAGTVPGDPDE